MLTAELIRTGLSEDAGKNRRGYELMQWSDRKHVDTPQEIVDMDDGGYRERLGTI